MLSYYSQKSEEKKVMILSQNLWKNPKNDFSWNEDELDSKLTIALTKLLAGLEAHIVRNTTQVSLGNTPQLAELPRKLVEVREQLAEDSRFVLTYFLSSSNNFQASFPSSIGTYSTAFNHSTTPQLT